MRSPIDVHSFPLKPQDIAQWAEVYLGKKFAAGEKEHGGNLVRKPTLDSLGAEIVDGLIYYYKLRMDVQAATEELAYALYELFNPDGGEEGYAAVQRAYSILAHGNPEGEKETEHNPDEVEVPPL